MKTSTEALWSPKRSRLHYPTHDTSVNVSLIAITLGGQPHHAVTHAANLRPQTWL